MRVDRQLPLEGYSDALTDVRAALDDAINALDEALEDTVEGSGGTVATLDEAAAALARFGGGGSGNEATLPCAVSSPRAPVISGVDVPPALARRFATMGREALADARASAVAGRSATSALHRLAGLCSVVGADRLQERARDCERQEALDAHALNTLDGLLEATVAALDAGEADAHAGVQNRARGSRQGGAMCAEAPALALASPSRAAGWERTGRLWSAPDPVSATRASMAATSGASLNAFDTSNNRVAGAVAAAAAVAPATAAAIASAAATAAAPAAEVASTLARTGARTSTIPATGPNDAEPHDEDGRTTATALSRQRTLLADLLNARNPHGLPARVEELERQHALGEAVDTFALRGLAETFGLRGILDALVLLEEDGHVDPLRSHLPTRTPRSATRAACPRA